MTQVYVQMAGLPGTGKSSIATALGAALPAVVLDHDVTKSALLETGISERVAGSASYDVLKALAVSQLGQGQSVILDSPCMYLDLLQFGVDLCDGAKVEYRFIECVLSDLDQLEERLASRVARPSQIRSLNQLFSHAGKPPKVALELIEEWRDKTERPKTDYLQLDTSMPMDDCVSNALAYVAS